MDTVVGHLSPGVIPVQKGVFQRARRRVAFIGACVGSAAIILFLYTWRVGQVPPYLNQDEAGFGLASYLLSTTGHDYFGNWLPPYIVYFDHRELGNAMISYVSYGYKGTVHLVEPADSPQVPRGALLLTRRQGKYQGAFQEVAEIPEIAPSRSHYSIMRKR